MMEIARSGVFMPARFYFHDIMLIFMAVMLTDVILLDVFNTVSYTHLDVYKRQAM